MTDRLYLTDSYLLDFTATVREARPHDDGVAVLLDRTAFYPTAGGQLHDVGTLGAARVRDVIDDGDEVVHVCDRTPGEGAVSGQVAWTTRFDHMQQHSGQHLLSAVLEESFRAPTISFHMGEETCTIDLDVPQLSADALARAEDLVNDHIWRNQPVHARFIDDAERATIRLRKDPAVSENVRVVSIADVDHSPCGGTHVRATGELGAIHLLTTERVRQTTRLSFVCGGRALRHARVRRGIVGALAARFTTRDSEIATAIDKLDDALRVARKTSETLTAEIAQAEAQAVARERGAAGGAEVRVAAGWSAERAAAFARGLVAAGVPVAVLVPSTQTGRGADIVVAVPPGAACEAGTVLREVCALVGGKGGGAKDFARGALAAEANLDAAAAALRERLGG